MVKSPAVRIPSYYINQQTTRMGQIYHTRLRLGCSSLKHDLFRRDLIESPNCTCGQVETTSHFLIDCPHYDVFRNRFLANLPCPLQADILTDGLPDGDDEANNLIFQRVQLFILHSNRFKTQPEQQN